jgi:myo-inositol-1(or 4)-monophosphatase
MAIDCDKKSWEQIERIFAVCRKAGDFQMQHFRTHPPGSGDEKSDKQYVSWIDVESEKILQAGLHEICPEAGFYGEETGQSGNQEVFWIVDPLDGTSNYLSGVELFSISVALIRDEKPELAVVYKPPTQDLFTAVRGQGARHNGRDLSPPKPLALSRALIGTGFPYRSPDLIDTFHECAKDILQHTRGIRRFGSAALDLSYIAAGYLQGFWESELQPYDVAAAFLMLEETGCAYANEHGTPYNMFRDRILVAGIPGVFDGLYDIVKRHYEIG